jgi:hypothetical protein
VLQFELIPFVLELMSSKEARMSTWGQPALVSARGTRLLIDGDRQRISFGAGTERTRSRVPTRQRDAVVPTAWSDPTATWIVSRVGLTRKPKLAEISPEAEELVAPFASVRLAEAVAPTDRR